MDKEDVKILKDDLLTLGLTHYEVEPLIKIAEVLPDSFGRSRFIGIGRDRLALVRPLLTKPELFGWS